MKINKSLGTSKLNRFFSIESAGLKMGKMPKLSKTPMIKERVK